MTAETASTDSFEANRDDCARIGDRLKNLVHQGNVRRVLVNHDGRTVAEFPLTAGVIGAVLAPALAAIGALVMLLNDCTITVERAQSSEGAVNPPAPADKPAARVA
jgi:hypothetical protein